MSDHKCPECGKGIIYQSSHADGCELTGLSWSEVQNVIEISDLKAENYGLKEQLEFANKQLTDLRADNNKNHHD